MFKVIQADGVIVAGASRHSSSNVAQRRDSAATIIIVNETPAFAIR